MFVSNTKKKVENMTCSEVCLKNFGDLEEFYCLPESQIRGVLAARCELIWISIFWTE